MEPVIYKPNHITENYISSILVRVFENPKYLKDFTDGKIYMNTTLWFAERELNLTEGQQDDLEGVKEYLNQTDEVELIMDFTEGKGRIMQGKRGTFKHNGVPVFKVQLGREKDIDNIFSCYSIWFDLEGNQTTKVDERMLKEFGKYSVIILNQIEFLERIERAVKGLEKEKIKIPLRYGYVNYINTEGSHVELGTFRKDEKYDYQNEFRIAVGLNREPKPFTLEVGSLEDILLVVKTEDVYKLEIKDNVIHMGSEMKIPIKIQG